MLACDAFLLLFIAATGMNAAQAINFPWRQELEDSVANPAIERQNFRTIKYRANNKLVWFEIGVEFMPNLKHYLKLRKYLLINRTFDLLFFNYGSNIRCINTDPKHLQPTGTLNHFLRTLHFLSPELPSVTPRQWRAAKQDYVIRAHDPATAAKAMQHSVETALKKYSNGSEVAQETELSSFFTQVEQVVLTHGQTVQGSEQRSIGICIDPAHPAAILKDSPIAPQCKGPEGCLFCDKHRVHADEKDVRKLFSARYCIYKTAHLASTSEQFDFLFGQALQRIDFILLEIKKVDSKLVEAIEHQVDVEGNLDPYWSSKFEMMMELGLL